VLRLLLQHSDARRYLAGTHSARAETLVRLGRRPEAIHDWQRIVTLGEGQNNSELRSLRAVALAHLGDHARATAEVKSLQATGKEPAMSLYNFACVYALSLRAARQDPALSPAERDRLAEQYGAYAVELVVKMRSAGFFKGSGVLEGFKKDTDLEPLRERADFQRLLQELTREAGAKSK
jgi:Flp pilus assembly protein TadD